MKRVVKIIVIVFAALTVLTNIPIVSDIAETFVDYNHYRFSNGDGTYTAVDNLFKNDRWPLRQTITNPRFFELHPSSDPTMYRLFRKNPFAFWRYGKYIRDPRYKLPYREWKEIKSRRPQPRPDGNEFCQF
jgi:hypothetical protein